jgi:hypothetical protein
MSVLSLQRKPQHGPIDVARWVSPEGHTIIAEVETTDAYASRLKQLLDIVTSSGRQVRLIAKHPS